MLNALSAPLITVLLSSFTQAMTSLSCYILKTKHETECDSVFERAQLTTPIFFFLELETGPLPVPEEPLTTPPQLGFLPASMKYINTARPSPKAFFKSFGVLGGWGFFGNRNLPNHTILYSQPFWALLFSKTRKCWHTCITVQCLWKEKKVTL